MSARTNTNHPFHLPEETFIFILKEPHKPEEMRLYAGRESTTWVGGKNGMLLFFFNSHGTSPMQDILTL